MSEEQFSLYAEFLRAEVEQVRKIRSMENAAPGVDLWHLRVDNLMAVVMDMEVPEELHNTIIVRWDEIVEDGNDDAVRSFPAWIATLMRAGN